MARRRAAATPRKPAGDVRVVNDAIELVPVDALTPHPENPRKGDLDAISQSLEAHGFYGVVVAQRSTGYVLAGNHRLLAAQQAHLDQLPVAWLEVDDDEARRILLADNRSNDLASYDDPKLKELLATLEGSAKGLLGTLYEAGEDHQSTLRYLETHFGNYIGPVTLGHSLVSYPLDMHGEVMKALAPLMDDPRLKIRHTAVT